MATLETIRKRAGILVSVVIGLALLAFVLGDFLTPGQSIFGTRNTNVGEVKGKKIDYQDFMNEISQIEEVYMFNSQTNSLDEKTRETIREQTWQAIVERLTMSDEYKALGLVVSPEELYDMVQGSEPHAFVKQLFTNQETGEFNRAFVLQFLKSLEQDETGKRKNFWLYMENEILRERMSKKYTNLISKGLYVTNQQVEFENSINSTKSDIRYVMLSYNTIPDSTIDVSKSELKKYLSKHAEEFEQEASRDIKYIEFPIRFSSEDFVNAQKWIEKIVPDFTAESDLKQFVNYNSDESFDEKYYKKDELADSLKYLYDKGDQLVIGPYYENESFKLSRIANYKMLPDSVKARHILIRPNAQTSEAFIEAKAKADSLVLLIKNGADFGELAKTNSADGSASKGGDLGWFKEGQMVKEFNDSSFFQPKGKLMVVMTQFGAHVLEVTDRGKETKKAQIATIVRKVDPSEATYQAIYQKASTFGGINNTEAKFLESSRKEGYFALEAIYIAENSNSVQGLGESRELVRWAYNSEKGQVSGPIQLNDRYVIACLTKVREKGVPEVEEIQDRLTDLVRKEKKKEVLMKKIEMECAQISNIDEVSTKLNVVPQMATTVNFNSYSIPGLGNEPAINAAASALKLNELSKPIAGNNGVFVMVVNNQFQESQESGNEMIKNRLKGTYQSKSMYESIQQLRKLAKIQDFRGKFF